MAAKSSTRGIDSASPEQRRGSRVRTDLSVEVLGVDGEAVEARITDLGHAGVGVSSGRLAGLKILWANQIRTGRTLDVRFELPADGARRRWVRARCKVIWSRPEPEGGWRIGLHIIEFWGADAMTLEQFLAAHTKPR
jgi:hypothetical protein